MLSTEVKTQNSKFDWCPQNNLISESTPYEYKVIQETQRKAMNFFLPSTTSNLDTAEAPSFGLVDFLYPASSSGTAGSLTFS